MKYIRILLVLLFTALITGSAWSQGQNNIDLANQYASTGEYEKAVVYFEKWYNRKSVV